jgi:uncharacterized membrane protein YfcA
MSFEAIGKMLGLGVAAGVIGGMFGIGGGLIMVPALILLFGYDTKTASGTSLFAQLLPVGLFGVYEYWRRGEVQVVAGLWVALGLLLGVVIGAMITGRLSGGEVRRAYGIFLILVGIYFLFWSPAQLEAKVKPQIEAAQPENDQVH